MRASALRALFLIGALVPAAGPASAQEATGGASLSAEDSALLANALVFDPSALTAPPDKALRVPEVKSAYEITRTQKLDGSTAVVVKQPLQTEWSNSLGADLAAPSQRAVDLPLPTERNNGLPAGAAWASVGVPNLASLDARVDPANEQGKLGTTLKHSVPFGGRFAVTLQDTYSVTEALNQPAGPLDLPLMTLPSTGAPAQSQIFGNEKSVKFNILPTGTMVGAGVVTASNDPVTHNTFSADQKLYGPLHVTTTVTDVGQTTSNKSLTAGFKLNW
jgi:hypothetical protein